MADEKRSFDLVMGRRAVFKPRLTKARYQGDDPLRWIFEWLLSLFLTPPCLTIKEPLFAALLFAADLRRRASRPRLRRDFLLTFLKGLPRSGKPGASPWHGACDLCGETSPVCRCGSAGHGLRVAGITPLAVRFLLNAWPGRR
jgi:hypothetical protein